MINDWEPKMTLSLRRRRPFNGIRGSNKGSLPRRIALISKKMMSSHILDRPWVKRAWKMTMSMTTRMKMENLMQRERRSILEEWTEETKEKLPNPTRKSWMTLSPEVRCWKQKSKETREPMKIFLRSSNRSLETFRASSWDWKQPSAVMPTALMFPKASTHTKPLSSHWQRKLEDSHQIECSRQRKKLTRRKKNSKLLRFDRHTIHWSM